MLEKYFNYKKHKTDFKTEVIAGLTTFLTMAYIMFLNPFILSGEFAGPDKGFFDFGAVFTATIVATAIACFIMAFYGKTWPIGLAPGMGINAFVAFGVVAGMGYTPQAALGAVLVAGLLGIFTHWIGSSREVYGGSVFLDPLAWANSDSWFWIGGEWGSAFILGCVLGLGCMVGDSVGSFIKRRRGLKREGEVSSKAPLLDTLPFAIFTFIFGQLFISGSIVGSSELLVGMVILLILTPIIHRSFNVLGYKLGLKSVPY